jgi:hypothetical protein
VAQNPKWIPTELGQGTLEKLAYIAGNPQPRAASDGWDTSAHVEPMAADSVVMQVNPTRKTPSGNAPTIPWMREEVDPWNETVRQVPSDGVDVQGTINTRVGQIATNMPSGAKKHFDALAKEGVNNQLFQGWMQMDAAGMNPDDMNGLVLAADAGDKVAQDNLKNVFGFVPNLDQHVALLTLHDLIGAAEQHGEQGVMDAMRQMWYKDLESKGQ